MHFFSEFLVTFFLFLVSKRIFLHKFSPWSVIFARFSDPAHFGPSKTLRLVVSSQAPRSTFWVFSPSKRQLLGGSPPWNQNAVLPVVGNWDEPPDIFGQLVFWSSGKLEMMVNDMDVTKLLYDISAISLGNSENPFLEKLLMCKLHQRF